MSEVGWTRRSVRRDDSDQAAMVVGAVMLLGFVILVPLMNG